MARLRHDDGTGPAGGDSLAGGFAGSDALAPGFGSDALAVGAGSDALATGPAADALAAGPSPRSTLAVPAAGDALAVGGGGRDPLSGYADATMTGDAVPLDRPRAAPDAGPVPPSTGPGPVPPSAGRAAGRPRTGGRRAVPAWARPGGSAQNPARPGPAQNPARPGSAHNPARPGSDRNPARSGGLPQNPGRPGRPARPGSAPGAGGRPPAPGGPTTGSAGGALPAPGVRSGPTWAELNQRGAPTGPRYGGPPPAARPRPPGTLPPADQGVDDWDSLFLGRSGNARGLGGTRATRGTRELRGTSGAPHPPVRRTRVRGRAGPGRPRRVPARPRSPPLTLRARSGGLVAQSGNCRSRSGPVRDHRRATTCQRCVRSTGPGRAHGEDLVATGFTFDRFAHENVDDPYPLYRRAREQAPVHFAEAFGVWVVSRYADVRRVVMDPTRFSSAFRIRTPFVPAAGVREILAEGHPEVPALINEDPPVHRRTRDLVARSFTPERIAALSPRVTGFVEELVDGFAGRGRADLVAELATPLPLLVICALIGLPAGDLPRVRAWAEQQAILLSVRAGPEEQRAAARASVAFEQYLAAEIAARRDDRRDDLLTDLVAPAADGGAPFTEAELVSLLISLIFVGQQTTADLIGSTLMLLLHRPRLWAALGADPDLAGTVVEETLRFDGPVQGVFRRAVFDVRVGGVLIPAGSRVFAALGSADRDAAVFGEPDEFDPGRARPEPHLAFGRGIHSCLGAELARIQARAAVEVLRRRIPELRLDPGMSIPYRPDLLHRGPVRLTATWTP